MYGIAFVPMGSKILTAKSHNLALALAVYLGKALVHLRGWLAQRVDKKKDRAILRNAYIVNVKLTCRRIAEMSQTICLDSNATTLLETDPAIAPQAGLIFTIQGRDLISSIHQNIFRRKAKNDLKGSVHSLFRKSF